LVDRRELLRFCVVEHIWATGMRNMRSLAKARVARAVAERMLEPFGPEVVGLSRTADGFAVEARFVSEPPLEARRITEVKGFPIRMGKVGAIAT
jgi:hypothetical protein